jgi:hypothetical protein
VDEEEIERIGDSGDAAGRATVIRLLQVTPRLFISGCRTSEGRLRLITWRTNADGSITRLDDSGNQAGDIGELSMCHIRGNGSTRHIATSVRTPSDGLKAITWSVSTATGAIERLGDSGSTMGDATQVASALSTSGHLVISCRTTEADMRLTLIWYGVSPAGERLTRTGDSGTLAGRITTNTLMNRPYGVMSAVADRSGRLKLIKWFVNPAGAFVRVGDSGDRQAGAASLVAMVQVRALSAARVVTAVKTREKTLKLLTWDDVPKTGELVR